MFAEPPGSLQANVEALPLAVARQVRQPLGAHVHQTGVPLHFGPRPEATFAVAHAIEDPRVVSVVATEVVLAHEAEIDLLGVADLELGQLDLGVWTEHPQVFVLEVDQRYCLVVTIDAGIGLLAADCADPQSPGRRRFGSFRFGCLCGDG
ncbi:hypothetical protein D3C80_1583040 [compost metagenome]